MASFTFIGSYKLYILPGETAPGTLTTKALYTVPFSEGEGGFKQDVTIEDCEVPLAGVNQVEASDIVKSVMEYSLKSKKLDMNFMTILLGGPAPAAVEATSIAVGTNFSFKAWCYMEWYRNGDTAGTPKFRHYGFQASISPDGEFSVKPTGHSEGSLKAKLYGAKGTFTTGA